MEINLPKDSVLTKEEVIALSSKLSEAEVADLCNKFNAINAKLSQFTQAGDMRKARRLGNKCYKMIERVKRKARSE